MPDSRRPFVTAPENIEDTPGLRMLYTRRYTYAILPIIGPKKDIPAPDICLSSYKISL